MFVRTLHSSGEADDPLQPDDSLEASAGLGMSVQILVIDGNRELDAAALHCQNMDPVKCIGIADLPAGQDFSHDVLDIAFRACGHEK